VDRDTLHGYFLHEIGEAGDWAMIALFQGGFGSVVGGDELRQRSSAHPHRGFPLQRMLGYFLR
jgi:hypothetical protein